MPLKHRNTPRSLLLCWLEADPEDRGAWLPEGPCGEKAADQLHGQLQGQEGPLYCGAITHSGLTVSTAQHPPQIRTLCLEKAVTCPGSQLKWFRQDLNPKADSGHCASLPLGSQLPSLAPLLPKHLCLAETPHPPRTKLQSGLNFTHFRSTGTLPPHKPLGSQLSTPPLLAPQFPALSVPTQVPWCRAGCTQF